MQDPRRGRGGVRGGGANDKTVGRADAPCFGSERPPSITLRHRVEGHLVEALFCARLAVDSLGTDLTLDERDELLHLIGRELGRAQGWGEVMRTMDAEAAAATSLAGARRALELAVEDLRDPSAGVSYQVGLVGPAWRLEAVTSFPKSSEAALAAIITPSRAARLRALAARPRPWLLSALVQRLRELGGAAGVERPSPGGWLVWIEGPPPATTASRHGPPT